MSQDQTVQSRELDDIFSFPGHDKAETLRPADDHAATVWGFARAGASVWAIQETGGIGDALQEMSVGVMPEGSGFEQFRAAQTPAPTVTPTTPSVGAPAGMNR